MYARTKVGFNGLLCYVVYFEQRLGAANPKRWSKYAILIWTSSDPFTYFTYSVKKLSSCKDEL